MIYGFRLMAKHFTLLLWLIFLPDIGNRLDLVWWSIAYTYTMLKGLFEFLSHKVLQLLLTFLVYEWFNGFAYHWYCFVLEWFVDTILLTVWFFYTVLWSIGICWAATFFNDVVHNNTRITLIVFFFMAHLNLELLWKYLLRSFS